MFLKYEIHGVQLPRISVQWSHLHLRTQNILYVSSSACHLVVVAKGVITTLLANSNTDMESAVVSLTYPTIILNADSSLVIESSHCINISTLSCPMQGSQLTERKRQILTFTTSVQQSQDFGTMCIYQWACVDLEGAFTLG